MQYKPKRDIPRACRELRTTSPSKVLAWIRERRTEREKRSGKRRQCTIKVHAVIKWMSRHPKVMQKIEAEIKDEELSKTAISETLFDNGTFREIDTVRTWILELGGREAKKEVINSMVNHIKRVCKGEIRKKGVVGRPKREDYEVIKGWGLRHPSRLSIEDGLMYIAELKDREHPTRNYRLALRNFFQSRGLRGWHKISGKIEQMGKYAHLFATKEQIEKIFAYLKQINYEAYLASLFAFKCGGVRTYALLHADSSKFSFDGEHHTIFVEEKATRGKPKRIQEKLIPLEVWELIKNRTGKLFRIEKQELRDILKGAYQTVIPKLIKDIKMPVHFWRHQFAQHGLRATNWNYGLIARLGHWTVQTLERYYGKMDRQTAFRNATKLLGNL